MIKGIGIDLVEIERFSKWHTYCSRLQKVFSQEEIDYCLKNQTLSAARFATRFAAKEAFYKAISQHLARPTSFEALCKHCEIMMVTGCPTLQVAWEKLEHTLKGSPRVHLSLTHTKMTAGAVVILETE